MASGEEICAISLEARPTYDEYVSSKADILLEAYEQEYRKGNISIIFTLHCNDEESIELRRAIHLKDPTIKLREYKFQTHLLTIRKVVFYRVPIQEPAATPPADVAAGEAPLPDSTSDQNA